jgi:hypothetical protein
MDQMMWIRNTRVCTREQTRKMHEEITCEPRVEQEFSDF